MRAVFIAVLVTTILFSCGEDAPQEKQEVYAGYNSEAEQIQKGKVLFAANCKVCHSFDPETPTGMAPVLQNINANWPEDEPLLKYIKNAPEMMQSTEHTRKLYQEWKDKAQMPPFIGLSEAEVGNIILYIRETAG